MNDLAELRSLCDAALEERLTAAQQERLEQLVLSSPAARRFYAEYLHLHASLEWSGMDPTFCRNGAATVEGDPLRLAPTSGSKRAWRPRLPTFPWRSPSARWGLLAVAAGLLLMLGLWQTFPGAKSYRTISAARQQPVEPVDDTIAVLVHALGAQWDNSLIVPHSGDPLAAGKLRLLTGMAMLEFYSGATVVLEGPADFELISRSEAYCSAGKVRALVPPHAQGFTIRTPQLELVDLGTEFGLHVGQGEPTEVHVFDGKVELYDVGPERAAAPRTALTTGEGVRLEGSNKMEPVPSDSEAFPSARKLLEQSAAEIRQHHQQWLADNRHWRTDPDLLFHFTFEQEDPWSRTLLDRADDEDPRHGTIVGCSWAPSRWTGKLGLEFKQVSDRVCLSLPGQFDSITLMTWARIDSLPNINNALLMSEGWEPGELHWQIGSTGTMILGVQSNPKGTGAHYHALEVIGPEHFGQWTHLAVVYDKPAGQVSHYVNGQQASREPILFDIPLRIDDAEIGNWNLASHRNNSPIRFFTGCIDEFMALSRPLSDEEIHEVAVRGRPPQ